MGIKTVWVLKRYGYHDGVGIITVWVNVNIQREIGKRTHINRQHTPGGHGRHTERPTMSHLSDICQFYFKVKQKSRFWGYAPKRDNRN